MILPPEKITLPLQRNTIASGLNQKVSAPLSRTTLKTINCESGQQLRNRETAGSAYTERPSFPATAAPAQQNSASIMPQFSAPVKKGQKVLLDRKNSGINRVDLCFGWKILDARCDVDVSAFLVCENGFVPNEDWFVFYGQNKSPDGSVRLKCGERSIIQVDLSCVTQDIKRIVFVVSIHEAFEKGLNFSMLRNVWVQVNDVFAGKELVSYQLEEYYSNVTSITICELYKHNGQWKFNPVGNGVNRDLAGQCAMYGVEIC